MRGSWACSGLMVAVTGSFGRGRGLAWGGLEGVGGGLWGWSVSGRGAGRVTAAGGGVLRAATRAAGRGGVTCRGLVRGGEAGRMVRGERG